GPETDDSLVELDGESDGPHQVIEPALALFACRADESRLVLDERVEEETGTGFDDAPKWDTGHVVAELREVCFVTRMELQQAQGAAFRNREVCHVWGQRRSGVTEVADDANGVFEPVVGKPVRVVAEEHGWLTKPTDSCPWAFVTGPLRGSRPLAPA